jgi:hypothetical protein
MPIFKLPLSGDVTQSINPWTAIFSPTGGQWSLLNIAIGQSSAPQIEADVLTDVAGYGKQLGRIGDAMKVLLKYLPEDARLTPEERAAIQAFEQMLSDIEAVKQRRRCVGPTP